MVVGNSVATYCREKRIYRIGQKKSFKKIRNNKKSNSSSNTTQTNLRGWERNLLLELLQCNIYNDQLSTKNYKIKKYVTYIEKKVAYRKCHWGDPDVVFIDKELKAVILNMFKELKDTMTKELKKSITIMSHQIHNINKEIEIIKKESNVQSRVGSTIIKI